MSSYVYHSTGQLAWNGKRGEYVYHSNGQRAWNGKRGEYVYHSNGQLLTSNGNGCRITIGEDIVLSITTESASLDVLGYYFELF
jgi:hypothetical protein